MRKLKISLERREAALKEIAKGKSPYDVARELKITPQAVYRWLDRAKREQASPTTDLAARVAKLEDDVAWLKDAFLKELVSAVEVRPRRRNK